VAIKILSGDSKEVTEYVAREVGLMGDKQIVYTAKNWMGCPTRNSAGLPRRTMFLPG